MRIANFLAIFIALILLLFGALSLTMVFTTQRFNERVTELRMASESIHTAQELKSTLLAHNRDAFLYVIQNEPAYLARRQAQSAEISHVIAEMAVLVASEDEASVFASLRTVIDEYLRVRRLQELAIEEPVAQYIEISTYVDNALAVIDRYIETNQLQMDDLAANISQETDRLEYSTALLASIGLALLICLFAAAIRLVTRPLSELTTVISAYGKGNDLVRAEPAKVSEIQKISHHFNAMAEKLRDSRQQQLSFIASVAHDLRNPLHSIAMYVEALLIRSGEANPAFGESIRRQIRFLDTLVGDLLDMSRIEAGKIRLEATAEDILPLLKNSVELRKAGTQQHKFIMQLPDVPLICTHDSRLISQVVNNLLSNAVKYSPQGGEVIVRATTSEGHCIVSVEDSGMGIDPDEIEKIFTPFHRSRSTRDTLPGVGLGLSSSRRIVEAHGGRLEVVSSPHSGTVFTMYLPCNINQ